MIRKMTQMLAGCILAAPLIGCYLFPREEKILAPPLMKTPEVTYEVLEVKRGSIEKKISAQGTFVSVSQANHYFKHRGGRLLAVYTSIGDNVKAGDLLAELDTENLVSEIKQQRLMLRKAETNYEKLASQADDRSALILASIDLESARLRLEDLHTGLKEAKQLSSLEGTAAANKMVQELENQIRYQKLALQKAELNYDKQKKNLDDRFAVIQASIDVELAGMKLDDLLREFEHSRLYASIDGRVVYVNYKLLEGDYINAYRTMVTVAEPWNLQLQYSGIQRDNFILGTEVDVKIKEEELKGIVVMTPANLPFDADDSLRDKIRIKVGNLPPDVKIGATARINLSLAKKDDVIVLPRRLVKSYGIRRYVQVLVNDLKEERDVQIGIETPIEMEIAKGLEVGDKVILR
jgi:multidrug efflux pump subunit AcrA (membrane-fusion protein)